MARLTEDADIQREVDAQGRVWFDGNAATELILRGFTLDALCIRSDDRISNYNYWCDQQDKAEHKIVPPADPANDDDVDRRTTRWFVDEPYASLPVRETLLARCTSDEARARVHLEMDLFEARELTPVLRLMFMLVDHFRKNKVVWGVGRGSSVASYVLYLIGVHRIDSLLHELDISEFLR